MPIIVDGSGTAIFRIIYYRVFPRAILSDIWIAAKVRSISMRIRRLP